MISSPARAISGRPACVTRGARLQIFLVSVLCLLLAGTSSSWAYWVAKSSSAGAGSAVAGQLSVVPAAPMVSGGKDTVIVKWPLSLPVDAVSSAELTTKYFVKRYSSPGLVLQAINAGCSGTVAGMGCTEVGVPAGIWQYTITPRMGNSWLGTESAMSVPITLSGELTVNNVYLWVTSN